MVVVVGALVGSGRSRRRVVLGLVMATWFWFRMPWWGITWLAEGRPGEWFGRLLQNSDCVGALVALALLWWVTGRSASRRDGAVPASADVTAVGAARVG
jgi:alpha-1,2-mannosyltransferase